MPPKDPQIGKAACTPTLIGKSTLEKLSRHSTKEIQVAMSLWNTVRQQQDYQSKKRYFAHAGALLALGELARDIIERVEDRTGLTKIKKKMHPAKAKAVGALVSKLRFMSYDCLTSVKEVWQQFKGYKEDAINGPYFQDIARLMQLSEAETAVIFTRLERIVANKTIAKDESAATKATTRDEIAQKENASSKKLYHNTIPQKVHVTEFDHLGLNKQSCDQEVTIPTTKTEPPSPPSFHHKREHSRQDDASKTKRHKTNFEPKVGDWKCDICGFWNMPWHKTCGGIKHTCTGTQDDNGKHVQGDDGKHGKHKPHKPFVPKVGDWKCGTCGYWNLPFIKSCGGADRTNDDPELRDICVGKKRDAACVQEDDGLHEHHDESPWVGDWFCGNCITWKPDYVLGYTGCGMNRSTCSTYKVKEGPGKVVRPPEPVRYGYHLKRSFS